MRSNTLLLVLTLCTSALAADDVVTMFIPDNEKGQALAGKVLGSQSDTTTYALACADSVKTCDLPSGDSITVVHAPSTMSILENGAKHNVTIACDHGHKSATCSLHVDDGGWTGTTTYPVHSYAVTVTATETETGSSGDTSASASASPSGTTWTSSSVAPTSSPSSTPTDGEGSEETDGPGNGAGAIGQEAGMSFAAGAAAVAVGVAAAVL
ncbi:uncharacterized protein APUU_10974S [Aspergillus puulaauensis]|uniref:GPI anchored protein n=1 Tax=Aspergillus puulaauensis TaxID=1220207 RepID=A0A7R8AGN5_9EURO|nr:uncharacterized protein APUU_10974S [Aspergillus puulaauensis]BCS18146.1 hypothetical protein APUU_10974S [Aspergillus puulaauensis]